MAFYISPAVYLKEVNKSAIIPAVATSIGVLVLRNTYKGPEMTQEYISSTYDLIQKFGEPTKKVYDHDGNYSKVTDCYEDLNSAMGFLKYGRNLYCTRVMPPSATFAGLQLDKEGNYEKFEKGVSDRDPLTLKTETMDGDITSPDEFHEESDAMLESNDDGMWMIANSRGYWGNNVRVALIDLETQTQILSGGSGDWDSEISSLIQDIDSPLETDQDFLLIIQSQDQGYNTWQTKEIHNVSLDESAIDDQGLTRFAESAVNQGSNYIRINIAEDYKNSTFPTEWVTDSFQVFGGGADNGGDEVDDGTIIEGYDLYKGVEDIDVNMFIDSNKPETVKRRLVELCQDIRKDSMAIVDVNYNHVIKNKGNEITDMVNWRKGLSDDTNFNQNSSYVAVYANWFNVYDKYLKQYIWIPSSGYVAGLYARTDNEADPWFAPAGLNRANITGVRKLAFNPSFGERDLLYKNGLNPIVSFSGQGKVVWGQKTLLSRPSAFNRVNVRRLFITLEKAISTASKYFLFEPNDKSTRTEMINTVEPFLRDVQSRRGIFDYRIVCDDTNNTDDRIDRNELWMDIYIAPTRTAEFIVLQFVATKTGANFDELSGAINV